MGLCYKDMFLSLFVGISSITITIITRQKKLTEFLQWEGKHRQITIILFIIIYMEVDSICMTKNTRQVQVIYKY